MKGPSIGAHPILFSGKKNAKALVHLPQPNVLSSAACLYKKPISFMSKILYMKDLSIDAYPILFPEKKNARPKASVHLPQPNVFSPSLT